MALQWPLHTSWARWVRYVCSVSRCVGKRERIKGKQEKCLTIVEHGSVVLEGFFFLEKEKLNYAKYN